MYFTDVISKTLSDLYMFVTLRLKNVAFFYFISHVRIFPFFYRILVHTIYFLPACICKQGGSCRMRGSS